MNLARAVELAAAGRLYPALILHGGSAHGRREAAEGLARALLCEGLARPCGECRHCARIHLVGERAGGASFHPDLLVLERDLRTATSIDTVRELLRAAGLAPFEARGQVFVIAEAETLSAAAADTLLKALEEPHLRAPRTFLLLAPSQFDLPPTLRSRSLKIYLGAAAAPDPEGVERARRDFGRALEVHREDGSAATLLAAAHALEEIGGWEDPLDPTPWVTASRAVLDSAAGLEAGSPLRGRLLELAARLLRAQGMRRRGIAPARILEGLTFTALGSQASSGAALQGQGKRR